jgi:hypothetical protein
VARLSRLSSAPRVGDDHGGASTLECLRFTDRARFGATAGTRRLGRRLGGRLGRHSAAHRGVQDRIHSRAIDDLYLVTSQMILSVARPRLRMWVRARVLRRRLRRRLRHRLLLRFVRA